MSRLAAMNDPPGGFWKFPETQNFMNQAEHVRSIQHIFRAINSQT